MDDDTQGLRERRRFHVSETTLPVPEASVPPTRTQIPAHTHTHTHTSAERVVDVFVGALVCVRAFGLGVLRSLDIFNPLLFLSASRTVRKKLQAIVLLNAAVCVVALAEAFGARRNLARAIVGIFVSEAYPVTPKTEVVGNTLVAVLGILPLFLCSLVLSAVWSAQMSGRAWALYTQSRRRHERRDSNAAAAVPAAGGAGGASPLRPLAEGVYRSIMFAIINISVVAIDVLPFVGRVVAIVLAAVASSFTAFDVRWSQQQPVISLHQRFELVQRSWPYFLGHGLFTALATFTPSASANAAIYAIMSAFLVLQAVAVEVEDIPPTPFRLPLLLPFKYVVQGVLELAVWRTRGQRGAKR